MFRQFLLLFGSVLVFIFACKSKKSLPPTQVALDEPVIALDTIKVKPAEKPKTFLYRASNKKSNDILHTRLEVRFDWQNAWLLGKATIECKPYFYPVDMLYLDARGMEIYKVQLLKNGTYSDLKYEYTNDSLRIQLDKSYNRDEKYTVFIDYKSKPNELKEGGSSAITSDKGLYFINPKGEDPDKMPQIWTQGETQSNSAWFPTIDSPNEKMTEEIFITVDDKYTTLSNGLLKAQKKNSDGTRTDHWVMDLPHAPYLVMMGIGEFKIVKDSWRGKDVWYYVEKEYEPYAKAIFGNTPEMLEFFSNRLGVSYPWQKYSQIVCRDYVSGAMENTTATLHGEFLYSTDRELLDSDQESVIAHELFHQWFGDLVTCESWSNLPLNESFATYGEYLWNEYKYGRDKADAEGYSSRAGYIAESKQKKKELIRFEYKSREDMFDGHSYNKGGQVLNMLRRYIGDDAFFASLKLYLERNHFNTAEIHNLRLCFEEVTGEDMNWFFNQWFLSKGHPEVNIETAYLAEKNSVSVKITQEQKFEKGIPLFSLPVKVDVYHGGKKTQKLLWVKEADQTLIIDGITEKPDLINVDADKVMLWEKRENKSVDAYVFQYKNAPLYLDRFESLEFLKTSSDPRVYDVAMLALNDRYEGLRVKAISMLSGFASSKEAEIKAEMIRLATNDKVAVVRAAAIKFLADNYKGQDIANVFQSGMNDRSLNVIATSLDGLASMDVQAAMVKAKQLEGEKSTAILFSLMDLYANNGSDDHLNFFMEKSKIFTGFESIGYYNMFGKFLRRCNDDNTLKGVEFIREKTKNTANRYVSFSVQKVMRDQVKRYEERQSELKAALEEAKKSGKSTNEAEASLQGTTTTLQKLQQLYNESKK